MGQEILEDGHETRATLDGLGKWLSVFRGRASLTTEASTTGWRSHA